MRYTITDGDNIVKVIEAGKLDYAELQVQTGQVLHDGGYRPDHYTYSSISDEFTLLADIPEPSLLERSEKEILVQLLRQLRKEGYTLPLHIGTATRGEAKQLVDQAAGRAKTRFVSFGNLTVEEYRQALKQATEFMVDTTQTAPPMIATWAFCLDTTSQAAAEDILATAGSWEMVLNATYDLRLRAKKAIDEATEETYKSVAQAYIDQLDGINP